MIIIDIYNIIYSNIKKNKNKKTTTIKIKKRLETRPQKQKLYNNNNIVNVHICFLSSYYEIALRQSKGSLI